MKLDLAIAGRGAVTPAGIGIDALLQGKATPTPVDEIRRHGQTWPVLRVDPKDPAFARWQGEPRLRRASSITFFLVEAAAQASPARRRRSVRRPASSSRSPSVASPTAAASSSKS
jgi:hypothetical protein